MGERIGNKILSLYVGRNSHRHHLWMWKSDCCGVVRGPSTIAHLRRSVKCFDCSMKRESNPRWKGCGDIPGVLIRSLQAGAEVRGVAWQIEPSDMLRVWNMQAGLCAYTGWRLSFGYKSETTASLDRIDNTDGYVVGNIQWVHKDINRMKNHYTEEFFLAVCRAVAENRPV